MRKRTDSSVKPVLLLGCVLLCAVQSSGQNPGPGVSQRSATTEPASNPENHTAQPFEEFNLCDVKGAGALYQVTIAGHGLRDTGDWKGLSYMEAMMRAYFDGSDKPVMLSSGLEDYFLGTYYFNRGRYANALAGLTHLDPKDRTFSAYRFHDDDPIFFQNGLRLTCRCGEEINGQKLHDPPETEYTTYCWIYQW